jgi:hypothetical protein
LILDKFFHRHAGSARSKVPLRHRGAGAASAANSAPRGWVMQ